jgi:hypothetical protein
MASYPSGTNTYVPNHAATGGLLVGFSRNQRDFPVNKYIQIFPVKNNMGLYASYTSRQAARIITPDDAEHLWADGDAAPIGMGQLDSFVFLPFVTQRRAYPFTVGDMAADQAEWNVIAVESEGKGQQAMTARTLLVQAALASASWGSNTATVVSICGAGCYWDTGQDGIGTNQGQNIRKSLQFGSRQVNLVTIGAVKPKNLALVINPKTAQRMAASTEILDYIKQSPFALAQMRGEAEWLNQQWDVPDTLYGYKITVEDAVLVSSRFQAAGDALSYVMADAIGFLIAFPGKLEGLAGTRSYCTVQCFFYKDEMTVESMYDQPNRRTTARVVSNYQPLVATVLSGFEFTGCFQNP